MSKHLVSETVTVHISTKCIGSQKQIHTIVATPYKSDLVVQGLFLARPGIARLQLGSSSRDVLGILLPVGLPQIFSTMGIDRLRLVPNVDSSAAACMETSRT